LKRRRGGPVWPPGRNGGSRCLECEARRNTLGVPPPYCNWLLGCGTVKTVPYGDEKKAGGHTGPPLRFVLCPPGYLVILHPPPQAAVPLLLWEGCPPGPWLSLIRHGYAVPPSPLGRLPSGLLVCGGSKAPALH